MTNKTKKIVAFALTLLMVVAMTSSVLANDLLDPSTIIAKNSTAAGNVQSVMGSALGIVQVVGIGVAVIMLVVLAVKYIAASPNEKADVKKGMTTYVIGAILLFGASIIVGWIKNFADAL